jgi:hypothetical protein
MLADAELRAVDTHFRLASVLEADARPANADF